MVIVGVAAHIHAAAPGGPRYLATMSSGERRSIQNGIWLCGVCGTWVDRDVDACSADRLRTWKAEAEAAAAREMNTRLPSPGDATAQLVAALSGQSTRFLPTVVGNAHRAAATALEQLDPRFEVSSKYERNTTTFTLHARETVSFQMAVPKDRRDEWRNKLIGLIQHGLTAELDATGVNVAGSPLLEAVFQDDGVSPSVIRIESRGYPVRVKLAAVETAGRRHAFDDVLAKLTPGQTSFRVVGDLWDGLAELTIQATHTHTPWSGRFGLHIDYRQWVGKDIRRLPYMDAVVEFFRQADGGARLDIQVLNKGERLMGLFVDFDDLTRDTPWRAPFLEYLARASEVVRVAGAAIEVPTHVTISPEDVEALERAHDMVIKRRRLERDDIVGRPSFPLSAMAGGENIHRLRKNDRISDIHFEQTNQTELVIFGQTIQLPLMTIAFHGVIPRVVDDRASFDEGDLVQVELELSDEFWMSFEPAA